MKSSYRRLIVWQKAMDLAVEVYRIAGMLPREEIYAFSGQMRRAPETISNERMTDD